MSDSLQRISSYLQSRAAGGFLNINLIHSMTTGEGGAADLLVDDLRQLLAEVTCQHGLKSCLVQMQEPSEYPQFDARDFAPDSLIWKSLGMEPSAKVENAIKTYVRFYIDADRATRQAATEDQSEAAAAHEDQLPTHGDLAREIQAFARPSLKSLDMDSTMVLPVGALWRHTYFKHLKNGGWRWGEVGMLSNPDSQIEQQQGRMEIRPVYLQQVLSAGAEFQAGVAAATRIVSALASESAQGDSATSKLSAPQILSKMQERLAALTHETVVDVAPRMSMGSGIDIESNAAVTPRAVISTAVSLPATMGGGFLGAHDAGAGHRDTAVMASVERAQHFDLSGDIPASREALCSVLKPLEQSSALAQSREFLKASSYKRIFINGPLLNGHSCNRSQFHRAAEVLRHSKWHVCMPHAHGSIRGTSWADFMQFDLGQLATCDSIFALAHWSKSKGASLLMHFAHIQGIEIIYAEGAETYLELPAMRRSAQTFADQVAQRLQSGATTENINETSTA